MPKRLVCCCDGTWNNAEDKTHIHWISDQCQREDATPLRQVIGYFAGVGTQKGLRIGGGTIGLGLSHNVREAYRFVLNNWQSGDELFIFGFSRGAYTARSLCGFLRLVGQLDDPDWVEIAYIWYRLSRPHDREPSRLSRMLGALIEPRIARPIEATFLGVFDTVGALGVPFRMEDLAADLEVADVLKRCGLEALGRFINLAEDQVRRPIEGFHDTELGAHVKNAYHALAVDERRGPFLPTLWTKVPPTSTVEQAWFAGVHGDVGGSYQELQDGGHLARVPLLWMLEKATALGLDLKPGAIEELRVTANPLAPQHDSLSRGWEALFKVSSLDAIDRPIGNGARRQIDPEGRRFPSVEAHETIHPSVRRRFGQQVEIRSNERVDRRSYSPANLPASV